MPLHRCAVAPLRLCDIFLPLSFSIWQGFTYICPFAGNFVFTVIFIT